MKVTRTFDLLERYKTMFIKPDALVSKKKGKWVEISSEQYIQDAYAVAYGLMSKGFKKPSKRPSGGLIGQSAEDASR